LRAVFLNVIEDRLAVGLSQDGPFQLQRLVSIRQFQPVSQPPSLREPQRLHVGEQVRFRWLLARAIVLSGSC
jgi:hypothetical protein